MMAWKHGAQYSPASNSTLFRVWSPLASTVEVKLTRGGASKDAAQAETVCLKQAGEGYWELRVPDCPPGSLYTFSIDNGGERPDPASRHQPGNNVHGPSAVVNSCYPWTDQAWAGLPLEEYVIYELHIGTFTPEGTFSAAIGQLPRLKKLGITAIEIMPIAQCPGDRNWGYDGVYPYAAVDSYGGLAGFQEFVNACHGLGIAVILDVVYNHLGPEGNYLSQFGPYFNDCYHTPWGASINFDAPYSDGVRDFFMGNADFWIRDCHVDALRLDAVHAIIDNSAMPFLRQLCDNVHALGRSLHRRVYVIGENDRNDPQFTTSTELGGLGADSQWSDDFHHALHAAVTGERHAYYADFGKVSQLAKAYTDGFVYDGCYSPSRKRHHGADGRQLAGVRFVAFAQNHDQVGNRPDGTRLANLLNFAQLKMCAVALLVSPYIPLLFMGEEFAADTPFLYFVSHGDPDLVRNVREGRSREFREFFTAGQPLDPQSEETFEKSRLPDEVSPEGAAMVRLYTRLIEMRRNLPALRTLNKRRTFAGGDDAKQKLIVRRQEGNSVLLCYFNFADVEQEISGSAEEGRWSVLLHSGDAEYLGSLHQPENELKSHGELAITLPPQSCIVMLYCGNSKSDSNGKP